MKAGQAGIVVDDARRLNPGSGCGIGRTGLDEDSGVARAVGEEVLEGIEVMVGHGRDRQEKAEKVERRQTPSAESGP